MGRSFRSTDDMLAAPEACEPLNRQQHRKEEEEEEKESERAWPPNRERAEQLWWAGADRAARLPEEQSAAGSHWRRLIYAGPPEGACRRKWASCKLLGNQKVTAQQLPLLPEPEGHLEEAAESPGRARQEEVCWSSKSAADLLALFSRTKKDNQQWAELVGFKKQVEEPAFGQVDGVAALRLKQRRVGGAKWRAASGARRRKVAASMRAALSSPALAQQPTAASCCAVQNERPSEQQRPGETGQAGHFAALAAGLSPSEQQVHNGAASRLAQLAAAMAEPQPQCQSRSHPASSGQTGSRAALGRAEPHLLARPTAEGRGGAGQRSAATSSAGLADVSSPTEPEQANRDESRNDNGADFPDRRVPAVRRRRSSPQAAPESRPAGLAALGEPLQTGRPVQRLRSAHQEDRPPTEPAEPGAGRQKQPAAASQQQSEAQQQQQQQQQVSPAPMGANRQAWLAGRHSASYQVAGLKRQLQPLAAHADTCQASRLEPAGPEVVGGLPGEHWPLTGLHLRPEATGDTGNGGRRSQKQGRQLSRSPVSLQKLTNARLAKHRLRIQQQRQEQLAQLALRERNQIMRSSNFARTQKGPQTKRDATSEQNQTGLYIINSRISYSHNKFNQAQADWPGRCRPESESRSNISQGFSSLAFGNSVAHHLQHQVIIPITPRSIEICDNQPACSSRHVQFSSMAPNFCPDHLPTSSASSISNNNNNNANNSVGTNGNQRSNDVIVFKSINMLRNTSSNFNHRPASGRKVRLECNQVDDSDDVLTISSGSSTLSLNKPFCKICHMSSTKKGDQLISPCKCSGTMQYIHCSCLLKWLEISNRTNEKPMSCELCAHEYSWHKKFNYRRMRLPRCSFRDVFLHIIFVLAIGVMISSAIAPIVQRKVYDSVKNDQASAQLANKYVASSMNSDSNQNGLYKGSSQIYHTALNGRTNHIATSHLAHDEKFMLICAASFFIAFFLAIYVQTKARDTLYGLLGKFLSLNQTYYITEYDHGHLNNSNCNAANSNSNKQQQQQQINDRSSVVRKPGIEELIDQNLRYH